MGVIHKRGMRSGQFRIACSVLVCASTLFADLPDLSTSAPDLVVPEMTREAPAPGKRVRLTASAWKETGVYHALYIPNEWRPSSRYPMIVEWTGNRYKSSNGDACSGLPEDAKLGYGMSGGSGYLWLSLPYVTKDRTHLSTTWWGNAPDYDPEPTLAYCRAAVREACDTLGADPDKIILAGFSRGSIACNYLGLHDEPTSALWRAFVCYSHYDGVRAWAFPGSDRASALQRLTRLKGRPQFICSEGALAETTRSYLEEAAPLQGSAFTFVSTGFKNHNDAWILRPSQARTTLRAWLQRVTQ